MSALERPGLVRIADADLRVTLLSAGRLWLDGGAMFGVVPKPLWQRQRPPDERNRICLALNVLLVEDGKRTWLVDTGVGDKWDERSRGIFNPEFRSPAQLLEPAGLHPDQIDVVVSTHLHFDHAGGNTVRTADGGLAPAFPNAEYVVQQGELELAGRDNERLRASYPSENFEPLVREDRVRTVEGEVELAAGLRTRPAPGHTPFHQVVLVEADGRTIAFLADLVPTASHLPYGWIMGYDLDPLATLESKKRLLPQAVREGWTVVFEHDDRVPLAVLGEREGRIEARPLATEA